MTPALATRRRASPGDKLPNGATLTARHRIAFDHEIVLARWGDECVTWSVFRDDDRSTCHGHYFKDWDAAWSDYVRRIRESQSW